MLLSCFLVFVGVCVCVCVCVCVIVVVVVFIKPKEGRHFWEFEIAS